MECDVAGDMDYPVFVHIPDSNVLRRSESETDLQYHEAPDVEELETRCWDRRGRMFVLYFDTEAARIRGRWVKEYGRSDLLAVCSAILEAFNRREPRLSRGFLTLLDLQQLVRRASSSGSLA